MFMFKEDYSFCGQTSLMYVLIELGLLNRAA